MEAVYNTHNAIIRNTRNYDINNMLFKIKTKTKLPKHAQFTHELVKTSRFFENFPATLNAN